VGLFGFFFPASAQRRRLQLEAQAREAAIQRVQAATRLAEAQAGKIRAESAALTLMEIAQSIKPGDLPSTKALVDGRQPSGIEIQSRTLAAHYGIPFPSRPHLEDSYFQDLRETYRVAREIDEARLAAVSPLCDQSTQTTT